MEVPKLLLYMLILNYAESSHSMTLFKKPVIQTSGNIEFSQSQQIDVASEFTEFSG